MCTKEMMGVTTMHDIGRGHIYSPFLFKIGLLSAILGTFGYSLYPTPSLHRNDDDGKLPA